MTLDETLRTSSAELSAERSTFSLPLGPWTARLTLDNHDVLGCLVWELSLSRTKPLGGSAKDWGELLAQRVTGLLEPLKLHESDGGRQLTMLRSEAPTSRGPALQYYEIELRGLTELCLRRYQGFLEPGKKREQIAFALTYEGLAKLLRDLSGEDQ
jgi:hypothetical protein